jgi:pyruvate dehydrogenase E2 component (dihydrolipoamide acetyltransferase)
LEVCLQTGGLSVYPRVLIELRKLAKMAEIVRMPKLSDTMTDGVVAAWHKKVGDKIKAGDLLAEIETDKATMEFESFQEGVLLYVGVEAGASAPVDSILAILGKEGEDYKPLLDSDSSSPAPTAPAEEKSSPEPTPSTGTAPSAPSVIASSDERLKASPLAKKMAEELGIPLSQISGSGDNGRIVRRDIENYSGASSDAAPQFVPSGAAYEEVPVSQMRKTIARRLAESKFSAPHFYLSMEVDMSNAMEARKAINAQLGTKISFNDMVIKAVSMALKKHPAVNSSWLGDKIRYNNHVNIGVAVAIPDGLVVPVVKNADMKSMSQISEEVREFAGKARDKKITPEDMQGNTFSISNLGMFGIDSFTAIINPPDACILAVGAIREEPVVKNGAVVPGHRMNLTLSCDHRVVDGATGSEFLRTLKGMLEQPLMMLA